MTNVTFAQESSVANKSLQTNNFAWQDWMEEASERKRAKHTHLIGKCCSWGWEAQYRPTEVCCRCWVRPVPQQGFKASLHHIITKGQSHHDHRHKKHVNHPHYFDASWGLIFWNWIAWVCLMLKDLKHANECNDNSTAIKKISCTERNAVANVIF